MNTLQLDNDLRLLNNTVCHYGKKGQEWYKNKVDRYQRHAKYAMGRPNPRRDSIVVSPLLPRQVKDINRAKREYITALKKGQSKDYFELRAKLKTELYSAYFSMVDVAKELAAIADINKELETIFNTKNSPGRADKTAALTKERAKLFKTLETKRKAAFDVAYSQAMDEIAEATGIDRETIEAKSFFPESKPTLLGKLITAIETHSVAKYVDSDGRVKPEIIEELKRSAQKERINDEVKKELTERGVAVTKDGYTISKGSELYRYAGEDDKLDHKRKYAYILDRDEAKYSKFSDTKYTYMAEKPLKIAPDSFVIDFFINAYGDKSLSRSIATNKAVSPYSKPLQSFVSKYGNVKMAVLYENSKLFLNTFDAAMQKTGDKAARERFSKHFAKYLNGTKDVVKAQVYSDLMKREDYMASLEKVAKKAGYDGVVDAEDALGYSTYPVILFDPVENMKISKKELKAVEAAL